MHRAGIGTRTAVWPKSTADGLGATADGLGGWAPKRGSLLRGSEELHRLVHRLFVDGAWRKKHQLLFLADDDEAAVHAALLDSRNPGFVLEIHVCGDALPADLDV